MELKEIVEQLELCGFEDKLGHPLENNVAFIELKRRANNPQCPNCGSYNTYYQKHDFVEGGCKDCGWQI